MLTPLTHAHLLQFNPSGHGDLKMGFWVRKFEVTFDRYWVRFCGEGWIFGRHYSIYLKKNNNEQTSLNSSNMEKYNVHQQILVIPCCNIYNNTLIQKKPIISLPKMNLKVLKFGWKCTRMRTWPSTWMIMWHDFVTLSN